MPHPENKTMEIYKTVAVLHDNEESTFVVWGTSRTDAALDRKRFKAELPDHDVTTTTVNIPTAKGPLVAWLNANVKV